MSPYQTLLIHRGSTNVVVVIVIVVLQLCQILMVRDAITDKSPDDIDFAKSTVCGSRTH